MANVKTAISLPGSLLERVDALARQMTLSRSRLVALALQELVTRYENARILRALNVAYADAPDEEERMLPRIAMEQQQHLVEGSGDPTGGRFLGDSARAGRL